MSTDPAWDAAVSLYGALVDGDVLEPVASPVVLDPGEFAFAHVSAWGWRFHAVDVTYAKRGFVAFGGPVMFGLTAAATAVGNRRARADAERLAAPQWRPLGELPIVATDRRLLVLYQGVWVSVWFAGIRQLIPSLEERRVELRFDGDPPYALCGSWAPYLTVVIAAALGLAIPTVTRNPAPAGTALPRPR